MHSNSHQALFTLYLITRVLGKHKLNPGLYFWPTQTWGHTDMSVQESGEHDQAQHKESYSPHQHTVQCQVFPDLKLPIHL